MERVRLEREEADRQNLDFLRRVTEVLRVAEEAFAAAGAQRLDPTGTQWIWKDQVVDFDTVGPGGELWTFEPGVVVNVSEADV